MFKIAIHLKKVKIAIHELQGLEDKRGKYEEQVAGASISSRVNSSQSKCLAEYEQTGSFAGKLSKTDIRSNGQGKKRKRELFSDTSRPQLVAPVINP